MTHHTARHRRPRAEAPDMEETRAHVMAAGKEILAAAQGALRFCKGYVETQVPPSSRANLVGFFQKAIAVADELSKSISGVETIKRAAGSIAKPLFTAMDREMSSEAARLHEEIRAQGPARKRAGKRTLPKKRSPRKRV